LPQSDALCLSKCLENTKIHQDNVKSDIIKNRSG
jgi:hypothetical protein